MPPGPHVFGDGRLGLWIIDPDDLGDRLAAIRAAGLPFTDMFLARESTPEQWDDVKEAGYFPNLWVAPHGRDAKQLAADTLADVARFGGRGACDLNVELSDDAKLRGYVREVVELFRFKRRNYRLRLNVAWRKAFALPIDLLQSDVNLYACEQNYVDPPGFTMAPASAADALLNLLEWGCPLEKASVCYGAAGPVGGKTGAERVNTLPGSTGQWWPRRGVVFSDQLLVDAGLL